MLKGGSILEYLSFSSKNISRMDQIARNEYINISTSGYWHVSEGGAMVETERYRMVHPMQKSTGQTAQSFSSYKL